MLRALVGKFLRDRRGATAVALAIMTVPLLIAASSAVDFARVASARTLLQAAVDSAAQAGVGAYQLSESPASAVNVATSTYGGTAAQLGSFVTINSTTYKAYCSSGASSTQCGTGGVVGATCPNNGQEYCVTVVSTATLKNSLFAWLIPSEMLTASSSAQTSAPAEVVSGTNFYGSGVGSAYDLSGIYAYAVPLNSNGTANYGEVDAPNSNCASTTGPIQYEAESAAGSGVTACNYLFVGDSKGDSGSGTLTLAASQPIAFSFVNDTGETTNYGSLDGSYQFTSDFWIGNTFYPNGYTTPSYQTCTTRNGRQTCVTTAGTQLYGECPDHTLYGSITQGGGAPQSDSENTYSSAYEVLGYPPTHGTNHVLTPFEDTSAVSQTVNGTTYKVYAECPQWPTTIAAGGPQDTNISAPVSAAYSASSAGSGTTGMNTYATYYPDTTFFDNANSAVITGGNAADQYPPQIGACTPVSAATSVMPNATTRNPWWGWSGSNLGNCTVTNPFATTVSNNIQTAAYNNCTLIIQPLGSYVPTSGGTPILPDYYTEVEDASGNVIVMEPFYDATTYVDPVPKAATAVADSSITETYSSTTGLYTVVNKHKAAYYPTATSKTKIGTVGIDGNGLYAGDYIVIEKPAEVGSSYDHGLPQDTSGHCYNPSVATQNNGYTVNGVVQLGYNADGTAVDAVANPQLGAVSCSSSTPPSYGLYWNDMGSPSADDLGYWNAITVFTCPTPATTNTGGGGATITG